ncbi:hypothetical protein OC844_007222 [Tilletia horrida]|nr:hypothetical protein OC844_007222 [Tilletia horrida]
MKLTTTATNLPFFVFALITVILGTTAVSAGADQPEARGATSDCVAACHNIPKCVVCCLEPTRAGC